MTRADRSYSRSVARRVIYLVIVVLAAIACTTDPPAKGGIFGDRPIDTTEEETDARPSDSGGDRASDAPSDRADTSTTKDAEVDNDN